MAAGSVIFSTILDNATPSSFERMPAFFAAYPRTTISKKKHALIRISAMATFYQICKDFSIPIAAYMRLIPENHNTLAVIDYLHRVYLI